MQVQCTLCHEGTCIVQLVKRKKSDKNTSKQKSHENIQVKSVLRYKTLLIVNRIKKLTFLGYLKYLYMTTLIITIIDIRTAANTLIDSQWWRQGEA